MPTKEEHAILAKEVYEKVWLIDGYRKMSPGVNHTVQIRDSLKRLKVKTILDVGCGQGLSVHLFNSDGFEAYGVDPAKNVLPTDPIGCFYQGVAWDLPEPLRKRKYDLIFSCDVLEHIEPEMLTDTFKELASVCGKYAYFAIALGKAGFSRLAGHDLHPSIFTADQWEGKVQEYFDIDQRIVNPSCVILMCNAKEMK